MIAILPELAVNGAQLMRSEAPGPELQKLTPRIAETARVLWVLYVGVTLLFVVVLYALHLVGVAPNMTAYNALAHGFSTLPTGGFSPEADSIAAFSPVVQWAFVPFMVLAGVNRCSGTSSATKSKRWSKTRSFVSTSARSPR
jgi:trk system potassium uptake protein TrkH